MATIVTRTRLKVTLYVHCLQQDPEQRQM